MHDSGAGSTPNPVAGESPAQHLSDLWRQGRPPVLEEFLARAGDLAPEQIIKVLRTDQHRRWQAGERVPAEYYLQFHPVLAARPDDALDLIYAEYLFREERGEEPAAEEFLGRFPQYADPLRRQLELHRALASAAGPESRGDDTEKIVRGGPRPTPKAFPPVSQAEETGPDRWPAVPGYEILGELGRGGMGVVYRARHLRLKRLTALKMIRTGSQAAPEQRARFRAEAEAVARLQHPNIVQIFEVGEAAGCPFLSLELVDGGSLVQHLGGNPQLPQPAARLVETLARAVHYAHERGVVHRDLKPANVLLVSGGVGKEPADHSPLTTHHSPLTTPKITDFGLAKSVGVEVESGGAVTETGAILGTPGYMAPEQAGGQSRDVGPAADIYALGAILYELLTGRPPFKAASAIDTVFLVRFEEPVPPSRLQPKVPRDLETICLKCLEKDPRKRYASAAALADDLGRFGAGEPIRARPTTALERGWRWCRRKPLTAGLAAALVLVVAGAIAILAALLLHAERLRDQAEIKAAEARRQHRRATAEARAARIERGRAEDNFRKARQAVDTYFTLVSQSQLLRLKGSQPLRKKLLEAALAYYRDFIKQYGDGPSLQDDLAKASFKVARITAEIGDPNDSLKAYLFARDIYARLSRAEPANLRYRSNLATCYDSAGVTFSALGRSGEALDAFQKSHALRKQLAREQPGPKYQGLLASSYNNLGLTHRGAGDRAQALRYFRQAVGVQRRLIRAFPAEAALRDALGTNYHNIALLHRDAGRYGPALAYFQKASAQWGRLAGTPGPAADGVWRKLALNLFEIGTLHDLVAAGQPSPDALRAYGQAFGIVSRLLRDHPRVIQYQSDLADIHLNVGVQEAKAGRTEQSLRSFRRARALYQRLGRAQPGVPDCQSGLAMCDYNLGRIHLSAGRVTKAVRRLWRSRARWSNLVRRFPKNFDYRSELGQTWSRYGDALQQLGCWGEAEAAYRRAIRHQLYVLGRDRGAVRGRQRLGDHYTALARLQRRLGKPGAAAVTLAQRGRLWPGDVTEWFRFGEW
jgi:serine/threonine-protein kinase